MDLESQTPPHDDGDPDTTLEAQFRDQVERSYFPDSFATDTDDQDILRGCDAAALGQPLQKDDEAYTFRLFARRKPSGPSDEEYRGFQKIVLGSPSPASGEPGFVNPERALAYYFTGTTSAGQAEQYRKAAVSGEQLLQGLKTRWVCQRSCNLNIWADSLKARIRATVASHQPRVDKKSHYPLL